MAVNQAVNAKQGTKFDGDATTLDDKSSRWRDGFARYDFVMDEQSLDITPFKAPESEYFGVNPGPEGQIRCIVIVPGDAAPGKPWSWRGCYWDHEPQAEIELLKRGFHVAYIQRGPGKEWDAWYRFLTERHGLSKKPAFIGMSRGGEYEYTWAARNPDKVSCVYADNPGANQEALSNLGLLAGFDVPILHICGSLDPLRGKFSTAIENIYQQFGGRISVMIKDGCGHHPHSLRDPEPIADFIVQGVQEYRPAPPAFVGPKFTRTTFYSIASSYRVFPAEGTGITCRGPLFTECYNRYTFSLPGVEGAISVIEPKAAASGKPWIFRADFVDRDALVDLALLAKGFHIVTGPVPYNADGPSASAWDAVFQHLAGAGFSRKPVMEGDGGAAGEVYAWAIENPDKVSAIYAVNPIMRSHRVQAGLVDSLAPLAHAGVPILHVCGSHDPWLNDNTRVVEERYRELGGQITIILKDGEGHYPVAPSDVSPVVGFVAKSAVL
ncbi:MAG TPA: alpha/beta hydrolase [Armatimonadota bacterium]|nr:alpha/beta hydrolase [Armatimonadota bacterium]